MNICEHCKKQPATVHLTDINNGVKQETHLCAKCAAAKGLNLAAAAALPNLIGALAKQAARRGTPEDAGPACPRCGLSWAEFRAKGRFGCPNDYVVFRERLNDLLFDMHGRDPTHLGRVPEGFAAAADDMDDSAPPPPHAPQTLAEAVAADQFVAKDLERMLQRENLQKHLREAIAAELYEEAARLRDRIRELG